MYKIYKFIENPFMEIKVRSKKKQNKTLLSSTDLHVLVLQNIHLHGIHSGSDLQ